MFKVIINELRVLRLYQIMSILQTMNKNRSCSLLHMLNNLINLNYIIINQRKLLTVFSTTWNSSKPIKFPHRWKLANQSTLNKAHVIEITKACKVAFMKARDSFVVRHRKERVDWKKNRMMKILFFKASS